ncbi:hypothetical protein SPHV1_180025 [Novosphingobium sp. KN65.2]|nr:hypothetical protein SPHV1_180025 [Novosphingobium sp. KN65.2]
MLSVTDHDAIRESRRQGHGRLRQPWQSPSTLDQIYGRRLAAPIDLDLEFKLIAFGEPMQTGAFDGADVYERVGLAIIAHNKAKALGAVEELDRAGSLLASRLPWSRGPFATFGDDDLTDDGQIRRGNLAVALDQLEFQLLAFSQRFKTGGLHGTDVHEGIVAATLKLDEAEALVRVEEFHGATTLTDNLAWPTTRTAAAKTATA